MIEDSTKLNEVKVLGNDSISKTTGILSLNRSFSFQAGQVIGITTSSAIPPRLYSISSAETQPAIEIIYKVIPEGKLTPTLRSLKPGHSVFITLPFGKFISDNMPACFIATGTGLAPFLSMIRSGKGNCMLLLHGSRSVEDFYEAAYLRRILGDKYVQCYTGNEEYTGFRGRVTAYIHQISKPDTDYKYYLCGSAEMVVETRELLIDRGIPFRKIHAEIYF